MSDGHGTATGAELGEAVGIDIGGTKMLAVTVDPKDPATIIRSVRRATPTGPYALLAAIEGLVADLACSPSATIGIGIPGLVDRDGRFRTGPNLPGVSDLDVGAELRGRFGRDVVVDNDATCATAAEFGVGAGAGHDDGVMLTIGTGIGGGLVFDGSVWHGRNGFAGEAGHMLVDANGPLCPCGRRGCWELYASGSGLGRLARRTAQAGQLTAVVTRAGGDVEAIRGEHVVATARSGDAEAAVVLEEFAWWLGSGIASLVSVLDIGIVVLGGGVMADGDLFLDEVRRVAVEQVMCHRDRPEVIVSAATLGPEAGAIGAAVLGTGAGGRRLR